jgi:hypothetical protein
MPAKITYFKMRFEDADEAQKKVWERQVDEEKPELTEFTSYSIGKETVLWTEEIVGQTMLRKILEERKVLFEEISKQQVEEWKSRFIGN